MELTEFPLPFCRYPLLSPLTTRGAPLSSLFLSWLIFFHLILCWVNRGEKRSKPQTSSFVRVVPSRRKFDHLFRKSVFSLRSPSSFLNARILFCHIKRWQPTNRASFQPIFYRVENGVLLFSFVYLARKINLQLWHSFTNETMEIYLANRVDVIFLLSSKKKKTISTKTLFFKINVILYLTYISFFSRVPFFSFVSKSFLSRCQSNGKRAKNLLVCTTMCSLRDWQ